jgi:replicative DNA helicase
MIPKANEATTEELLAEANKQLPFSDEAEKGFLSCLFHDPVRVSEVRAKLPLEVFYHPANQPVYEAFLDLDQRRLPIDVVSVTKVLLDRGKLDKCGGNGAISEIFTFVPAGVHFDYYRKVLIDKWLVRRALHNCAQSIAELNQHGREDVDQDVKPLIHRAEQRMFSLVQASEELVSGADGPVSASVIVGECWEHTEYVMKTPGEIPPGRITTGFPDLDRATKGLEAGDKLIIGARPKMGKTIVLCSMAKHIAVERKIPTLIFQLEMKRRRFMNRILFGGYDIETEKADTGFLSKYDQENFRRGSQELQDSPLWVDDDPSLDTAEFRARVRIAVRNHGIKVVMLDYVQMLNPSTRQGHNEERLQIKEAMATLHAVAKEEGVVIIALAQANRDAERNPGAEPGPKDFDGGSAIEKYVDYGAFIHRPCVYKQWEQLKEETQERFKARFEGMRRALPDRFAPPKQARDSRNQPLMDRDGQPRMEWDIKTDWNEHAQLLLCLNRNGGAGRIDLRFRGEFTRFDPRNPHLYSNNKAKRQQHDPIGNAGQSESPPIRKKRSDHGDDWAEGLSGDDD